jgi:tetratricopeptide (TPR) repeat protein
LPDREAQWGLVTGYRVRLAQEERDWSTAERLQRAQVAWCRQQAAPALAALDQGEPLEKLEAPAHNTVRTLAVSVSQLGHMLRRQGKAECVEAYKEAIPLYRRIGDAASEAIDAYNLGRAYMELPALRDLDAAERWYRRDLELEDPHDRMGRAQCLIALGHVNQERFKEVRTADQSINVPNDQLTAHLNAALDYYRQALDLLPTDAVDDLMVAHGQMGNVYSITGDLDRALAHYGECIRYAEAGNNFYDAGGYRRNVALALAQRGRLDEARLYAQAALRNFQHYQGRAAQDEQDTQQLLAQIERAQASQ